MIYKRFFIVFVFTFFANSLEAEKVEILRSFIPNKCFYYRNWEVEDTYYKEELLNKFKFNKYIQSEYEKSTYKSLDIIYDDSVVEVPKELDSKWDAKITQLIHSILIDI